jgi:hypothetical protein
MTSTSFSWSIDLFIFIPFILEWSCCHGNCHLTFDLISMLHRYC